MTCETCGEKKPKNDSPSFTKATVEILNPKELSMFRKVVVPASMGDDTTNPPKVGKYCNVLLYYEANEQAYLYSSDGIPTKLTGDLTLIKKQIKDLQDEDVKIWEEIEEIEMSSDVVDIVGTYAELQQYDTSKLHDNDIIKVLRDETHQNETAYYRWSTSTDTFSYVGSEGPYYTESEVDALLAGKQDVLIAGANIQIAADGKTISATDTTYTHFTGATASTDGEQGLVPGPLAGDEGKFLQGDGTWGTPTDTTYTAGTNVQISAQNVISATDTTYSAGTNVQISPDNVISATDTTYSDFVGTDGQTAGTAGLVPAPATADEGKFLKADGTWDDAGSPINVVQTTGTSTTDVMSQNAVTSMIYANPSYNRAIRIASTSAIPANTPCTTIGINATARGFESIAINGGNNGATATGGNSIIIGSGEVTAAGAISIGFATPTNATAGKIEVGSIFTNYGYNNSTYRLLTGLYDPQNAHDAATKGYVDTAVTPNNISSNDWSALWQ